MHTRTSSADTTAAGGIPGTASPSEAGETLARSKDELWREFRNLVNAGDALLRSTTSLSGDALAQARASFRDRLADAKDRLGEASRTAMDRSRDAATATDEYVHRNPWPALGVALAAGVLAGILVARR